VITIPHGGSGRSAIIAAFTTLLILALLARALSLGARSQRLTELDALLDEVSELP
jgi:hypothetical protein